MRLSRRTVLNLLAVGASAAAAGCAGIAKPQARSVALSSAQLFQIIGKQFPYNGKLLEVLDVALSSPKLKFDAANNRLVTALDLSVQPNALGQLLTQRVVQGQIELSYGLRFEPSDRSIRMTDVKVNKLEVTGVPAGMQRTADRIGPAVAERLLKDFTLHQLKADDLKAAKGWGYQPGAITVQPDGISMALVPVEQR